MRSSRPTLTTRGRPGGKWAKTVGRFFVARRGHQARPACDKEQARRFAPARLAVHDDPVVGPTVKAGVLNVCPLTLTRPSAIQRSASRREHSPARAITLATRSESLAPLERSEREVMSPCKKFVRGMISESPLEPASLKLGIGEARRV